MTLPTHVVACFAAAAQLKPDPLHEPIARDRPRAGYAQIVFRKRGNGYSLSGFDWYIRKGSFGLSIQKPFDVDLGLNAFAVLFPGGIRLDGTHISRPHVAKWGGQLVVDIDDVARGFADTEEGEAERACYRGHLFADFIRITLPVVKTLVAAKLAARIEHVGEMPGAAGFNGEPSLV